MTRSERHLRFNMSELCGVIANSVNQSVNHLTSFSKIAEGGSYRIFEATFQDGFRAIARLPYPCSIPHRYGVASEVATMEFLRLHGIPIPKIFDWSSTAETGVGSEYMIIERVPGRELDGSWYTMTPKDRMAAVEKIVHVERILFAIEFPASGSLFYADSIDDGMDRVEIKLSVDVKDTPKFCIGPSTEYLWWYQKRHELGVHGGPCKVSDVYSMTKS